METKYTPTELESLETKYSSEIDIKFSPSDIESTYNPSEIETKYSTIDFLGGAPNTPRSLSDFSTTSPDAFMSSRDTSPLNFVSTPITELSPLSNGEETKTKPEPEKKPVKKRKSWGQQLPTPTTNLAPRKRAKTAEEKEQRRVERVLRNRAAAQKSREVKKQQLEKIEQERDVLKEQNELLLATNRQLEQLKLQLLEHTRRLEDENRRLRDSSTEIDSNGNPIIKEQSLEFAVRSAFLDPTNLLSNCESIPSDGSISFPSMTHQPAVSAEGFNDDIFTRIGDHDGLRSGHLFNVLDEFTDVDSGLATSPESSSILSPDPILEDFIDCTRDNSPVCDESSLQLSFGASPDSDGL